MSQPVKLTIEANKIDGVNAFACKDPNEINDAIEAGANTIILDMYSESLENMAAAFKGGASSVSDQPQQRPPQRIKAARAQAQKQNPSPGILKRASESISSLNNKDTPRADGKGEALWDGKKGIKKNLKDLFGLE